MLRIAVPLAFAELGWMSMYIVDNIMVGHLPESAVAIGAASVGGALFSVVAIFAIGLMSGMDTLISQAFGANDWPDARRTLASSLALVAFLAPVVSACIFAMAPLLEVLGVERAIRAPATEFVRMLVWSLPMLLLYTTFRRYLQGVHCVRPVTFALITSNLVNIAGNWVLI